MGCSPYTFLMSSDKYTGLHSPDYPDDEVCHLLLRYCWPSFVMISSAVRMQTAVAADSSHKQLLLFAFALRSVCQYSMAEENPAAQKTAVTASFSSKQLLLFVFALKSSAFVKVSDDGSSRKCRQ